jgi:RNA polymerase sigma factor (TIGR02999 family)
MPSGQVTELLSQVRGGKREALDVLLPVVYGELRKIAARYMRAEWEGHTLQPTALVHEAYLRLVDQRDVEWQSRAHFFGVAAQLMRRLLVDHARGRNRRKRGGGLLVVPLDGNDVAGPAPDEGIDMVGLDAALDRLSELSPQQGRIVELRYFGGLSIEETAEVLGVSTMTVKRGWAMARAWLRRELSGEGASRQLHDERD